MRTRRVLMAAFLCLSLVALPGRVISRAESPSAPLRLNVQWATVRPPNAAKLQAVTYVKDRWVAAGEGGHTASSTDGLKWATAPAGDALGTDLIALTGDPSSFVLPVNPHTTTLALGKDSSLFIADTDTIDSAPWRKVAMPNSPPNALAAVSLLGQYCITAGDGLFSTATLQAGPGWSKRALPDATGRITGLAWGSFGERLYFVAAGESGILVSSDAVQWTKAAGAGKRLRAVAFGDGMFVALGSGGSATLTVDGATWTNFTTTPAVDWTQIAYAGGLFVALGGGAMYGSADGIHWQLISPAGAQPVRAFGLNAGRVVALRGEEVLVGTVEAGQPGSGLPTCEAFRRPWLRIPGEVRYPLPWFRPSYIEQRFGTILEEYLYIDGAPLTAITAPDLAGLYVPESPLEPGTHTVRGVWLVGAPGGGERCLAARGALLQMGDAAVAKVPDPSLEAIRATDYINELRAAAGLQPYVTHPGVVAAAYNHAGYLVANAGKPANAHDEVPGMPLFTGKSSSDRVRIYGPPDAGEIITWTHSAELAVDNWMETLYHRLPLVGDGRAYIGFGRAGTRNNYASVLNLTSAGSAKRTESPWPYPGQTGVPVSWLGAELPDPFRLYPGVKSPYGYPITLSFVRAVRITLTDWSLTGPDGSLAAMTFDPDKDDMLGPAVALIPYKPLRHAATYTVHLKGMIDPGDGPRPFDRTWSFTTENGIDDVDFVQNSRVTVRGTAFGPGMQVFMGGLACRDVQVESDGVLSFTIPRPVHGDRMNGYMPLTVVWPDGSTSESHYGLAFDAPAFSPELFAPVMVTLTDGARRLAVPGLRDAEGRLVVAELDLAEAGVPVQSVPESEITYVAFGGRTAEVWWRSTLTRVAGRRLALPVPPMELAGRRYLPVALLEQLSGSKAAPADPPVPAVDLRVTVNGRPADAEVVVLNGYSLIPLRTAGELLKAKVGWDEATRTAVAEIGGRIIRIRPGAYAATLDGREVRLDAPAILHEGRTYVPLQLFGAVPGVSVGWNDAQRTIEIRMGAE
ncbi:MAG TPA: stalk domain-containing protein [Symbiobacteriaceae bacterium]|nr:stalk domain-containing protein [Symbiobacteriaceae bacterium]